MTCRVTATPCLWDYPYPVTRQPEEVRHARYGTITFAARPGSHHPDRRVRPALWQHARRHGPITCGVDGDCLAQASLFAAFAELVGTYGEDAVAKFVEGLPLRVRNGEFSTQLAKQ